MKIDTNSVGPNEAKTSEPSSPQHLPGAGRQARLGVRPWLAGPKWECRFAPPQTEMEKAVAQVWSQVLGHSPVGLHENFFEIGGHSLRATRLTARLRELFHIRLSIRSVFEKPTVAELAREIERLRSRNATEANGGICRAAREPFESNEGSITKPLSAHGRGER